MSNPLKIVHIQKPSTKIDPAFYNRVIKNMEANARKRFDKKYGKIAQDKNDIA